MKDKELLQLLRRDPEQGINALAAQYTGLLRTAARAKLPASVCGDAEIEDIVADTLSAFYLSLDRFRPAECSIKTYLCVMAHNRAADVLRRSHVIPLPLDDADEADDSLDVADDAEERDLRRRLLDAIKALGELDSSILIRRYYLGQSAKEIAAALGLTASNVDTRAHRAIRKLKELFKGESL